MLTSRKSWLIIIALGAFVMVLSQCIGQHEMKNDPRGSAFAGPATCRQCHQAIYDSVLKTAHFNASAPATAANIPADLKSNPRFIYDSVTRVAIAQRDSGFYQVLYVHGKEKAAYRFDISFGKRHAQTFLYWQGNNTYELPLSFYTGLQKWATSPGFASTRPDFSRLIGRDCFECHSSYVNSAEKNSIAGSNYFSTEGASEALNKASLVYGIDCERCHGPAAEHVSFQQDNPGVKTARFITVTSKLNRQQQLDQCAVCHGGNDGRKLQSRFYFRPGENLADYFLQSVAGNSGQPNFDVHGNQSRLLASSKCFIKSNTLTCGNCHNPHQSTTANPAYYIQQCISCHNNANQDTCTVQHVPANTKQSGCINCHMPLQNSAAISFQLSANAPVSAYQLRTHKIAVYK